MAYHRTTPGTRAYATPPPRSSGKLPGRVVPSVDLHRILKAIHTYRHQHGRGPSVYELEDMLGCHYKTIYGRLCQLRRDGYVDWEPNQAGTLHITERYE